MARRRRKKKVQNPVEQKIIQKSESEATTEDLELRELNIKITELNSRLIPLGTKYQIQRSKIIPDKFNLLQEEKKINNEKSNFIVIKEFLILDYLNDWLELQNAKCDIYFNNK